jgi:hypothetical protein
MAARVGRGSRITATIGHDLPDRPRSFRLSDQDLDRLQRLQHRLGRSQTDIVSMALVHLLVSLERDERIHLAEPPHFADPLREPPKPDRT